MSPAMVNNTDKPWQSKKLAGLSPPMIKGRIKRNTLDGLCSDCRSKTAGCDTGSDNTHAHKHFPQAYISSFPVSIGFHESHPFFVEDGIEPRARSAIGSRRGASLSRMRVPYARVCREALRLINVSFGSVLACQLRLSQSECGRHSRLPDRALTMAV
jgi:hypothetical protein